jgi:hypothetical protein
MCRRLTVLTAFAGALVLGGVISPAFGADGSGTVYIPNPVVDPSVHTVALESLDGSGYLRGSIVDVTNSLTGRAYSGALIFTYDPSVPGANRIHFAETMAYYHTVQFHDYLGSIGIPAPTYQVPTVVFAARKLGPVMWVPVASAYDPTARQITLAATPNMEESDATDADLILHEYAHAVEHYLRGGGPSQYAWDETTTTQHALAMFEGVADFLACSRFGDPQWGEWAAANWQGGPFIRNIDNFYRLPQNLVVTNPYPTGMILSGALWDLRSAVGPGVADRLALTLIQTVLDNDSSTPQLNTTYAEALTTLIQADANLYGSAHESELRQALAAHGIGTFDFSTPFPKVLNPGDNYDGVQSRTIPGAPAMVVTFDKFITKLDNLGFTTDELPNPVADAKSTSDWLTILDGSDNVIGRFTGRQLQGATMIVPGDTVKFHLTTDGARAPFGYRVVDINTDLSNRELVLAAGETVVVPLEAASKDLGSVPDAWRESAAIGTLTVGTAARAGRVRLVDAFANYPGGKPEALYVHNLTIAEGSNLDLAGLHLYINGTFANAGTLDVNASSLVIDYGESRASPLAQIAAWVKSGRNLEGGVPWDGPGITSAWARDYPDTLGIAATDNASLEAEYGWRYGSGPEGDGYPLFGNVTPVPVDDTAMLVKTTYLGDLDLDGDVDLDDLILLSSYWDPVHYYTHMWWQGDMNYDGWCDLDDLILLAGNWQLGVGDPLSGSPSPQGAVPEPATLALLAAGGLLALGGRRVAR